MGRLHPVSVEGRLFIDNANFLKATLVRSASCVRLNSVASMLRKREKPLADFSPEDRLISKHRCRAASAFTRLDARK